MSNVVYTAKHPFTGMFYIGCTNNIQQRKWQHYSDLRKGIHANEWMQLNYGYDNEFIWEVIEVDSKEAAQALEKKMIHENEENKLMMNIQSRPFGEEWCAALSKWQEGRRLTPEHRKAVSDARKGVALGEEHRATIAKSWTAERRLSPSTSVTIEGIEYPSGRAAARKLDVSSSTIRKRCKSDNPLWVNWKFTLTQLII